MWRARLTLSPWWHVAPEIDSVDYTLGSSGPTWPVRRSFRNRFAWAIAPAAILGCGYLLFSLPSRTQLFFAVWNVLGVLIYLMRRGSPDNTG